MECVSLFALRGASSSNLVLTVLTGSNACIQFDPALQGHAGASCAPRLPEVNESTFDLAAGEVSKAAQKACGCLPSSRKGL